MLHVRIVLITLPRKEVMLAIYVGSIQRSRDELSNGKEALADPCQARNVFLFLPSSCAVMNHSSQQCMLGEMALEEQSWLIRASLNGGRTVVHCTVVHCREY